MAHHSADLGGLNAEPVGPGAERIPHRVSAAPFTARLALGDQIPPNLLPLEKQLDMVSIKSSRVSVSTHRPGQRTAIELLRKAESLLGAVWPEQRQFLQPAFVAAVGSADFSLAAPDPGTPVITPPRRDVAQLNGPASSSRKDHYDGGPGPVALSDLFNEGEQLFVG